MIPDHQQYLWNAWRDLCHDRTIGFGYTGTIVFAAIDAYATRIGITDPDEFADFLALMREVDAVYLTEIRKRQDKGSR